MSTVALKYGDPVETSGGSGGEPTNLTYTAFPDKGHINSSTGTGADIPAGSTTNASLMLPADKIKLDGITPASKVTFIPNDEAASFPINPENLDRAVSELTSNEYIYSSSLADWVLLTPQEREFIATDWITTDSSGSPFTLKITAPTTDPILGDTSVNDLRYKRMGSMMLLRFELNCTTGGTAGSTPYTFDVSSLEAQFDLGKFPANSLLFTGSCRIKNPQYPSTITLGSPQLVTGTSFKIEATLSVSISGNNAGLSGLMVGNEIGTYTGKLSLPVSYTVEMTVPIVGWNDYKDKPTSVSPAQAPTLQALIDSKFANGLENSDDITVQLDPITNKLQFNFTNLSASSYDNLKLALANSGNVTLVADDVNRTITLGTTAILNLLASNFTVDDTLKNISTPGVFITLGAGNTGALTRGLGFRYVVRGVNKFGAIALSQGSNTMTFAADGTYVNGVYTPSPTEALLKIEASRVKTDDIILNEVIFNTGNKITDINKGATETADSTIAASVQFVKEQPSVTPELPKNYILQPEPDAVTLNIDFPPETMTEGAFVLVKDINKIFVVENVDGVNQWVNTGSTELIESIPVSIPIDPNAVMGNNSLSVLALTSNGTTGTGYQIIAGNGVAVVVDDVLKTITISSSINRPKFINSSNFVNGIYPIATSEKELFVASDIIQLDYNLILPPLNTLQAGDRFKIQNKPNYASKKDIVVQPSEGDFINSGVSASDSQTISIAELMTFVVSDDGVWLLSI